MNKSAKICPPENVWRKILNFSVTEKRSRSFFSIKHYLPPGEG